jgi:hypothetical protein
MEITHTPLVQSENQMSGSRYVHTKQGFVRGRREENTL